MLSVKCGVMLVLTLLWLQSVRGPDQPHLDDAGTVWRIAVRLLQLRLCDEHVQV